ncbi:MAG: MATE family efflux transporter [Ruminococcaceae bacterium]|nr:MATE family efflux transporter [Oscillospiraceae bacterium]
MSKRYEMDMTTGPLLGKMIRFALPVVLSNVLQLLYNAADSIIVGRFDADGKLSLAAVGSTASIIHLVTNLFIGFFLGASIIIAQFKGAGKEDEVSKTVHTGALTSLLTGIVVCAIGLLVSEPLLVAMDTPAEVIDKSLLYIRIYFLGMPFTTVYNFGASTLRAVGDTKRPLYFLALSGVVNVALNALFVIVFHMSVAGVAAATVISQALSAVLVTFCLLHAEGSIRLNPRRLRINGSKLVMMAKVGVPVGLQNALFSFSNVLIQSSINGFGSAAMAAHTAAVSIEGFMNVSVAGVADTSINFTGQNVGAGKYDRVRRVCVICSVLSVGISLIIGAGMILFGDKLLAIYNPDPEVIAYGLNRTTLIGATYWSFALMSVFSGCMRGMGRSALPMLTSVLGICGFRILYIYTIFAWSPTLLTLYISYPASWVLTMLCNLVCYLVVSRMLMKGRLKVITKG